MNELSPMLLQKILGHVDPQFQHDLASAAQACSQLREAAAPARPTITLSEAKRQAQLDSLVLYLSRHGTHVTRLELGRGTWAWDARAANAALEQLSTLTGSLQELHLDGYIRRPVDGVGLPGVDQLTRLTRLTLQDSDVGFSLHKTPAVCKLSGLQHLAVVRCSRFNPGVLARLRLRVFVLEDTPLAPAPPPLPGLAVSAQNPATHPGAVAALLAQLANQAQLRSLSLGFRRCGDTTTPLQWAGDSFEVAWGTLARFEQLVGNDAAYAALTASPYLESLTLCSWVLPAGAAHAIFSPGRRLSALTALDLERVETPDRAPLCCATTGVAAGGGASGLQALADACPALRRLAVRTTAQLQRGVPRDGEARAPLEPLASLTALTHLSIDGVGDADVSHVLASLPGLQELLLSAPCRLSNTGLLPLRALPHLTRLALQGLPHRLLHYFQRQSLQEQLFLSDGACAAALAHLTQLRELRLFNQGNISAQGLLCLTALRRLTHLEIKLEFGAPVVELADGSKALCPLRTDRVVRAAGLDGYTLSLDSQAPAYSPPDVWSQLLDKCLRSNRPAVAQQAWEAKAQATGVPGTKLNLEELLSIAYLKLR